MSNFSFQINEAELRKEAEKLFRDKALATAEKQINILFREAPSQIHYPGSHPGVAYQLIQERISNEILSEKTQKIMDAYMENNWQRILEESMEKAMRKAAEHKANQMAFAQANLKNPREAKE